MKTKNLYYHHMFQRTHHFKAIFLSFFVAISSWFRVPIEVITRRHFGQRYFLFPLCVYIALALAAMPIVAFNTGTYTLWDMIEHNLTWYGFIVLFLRNSYDRYLEVRREPGVYDFERFSLSPGIIHAWFYKLELFDLKPTTRIIAIYLEPGLFLLAGIILALLQQNIGYVFIVCSIIYSASWAGAYYMGDEFILDKIDDLITSEELTNTFVHNRPPKETKGFEVDGTKIKNPEFRRKLAESMIEEEPAVDVL
jgi:hypothetical protein